MKETKFELVYDNGTPKKVVTVDEMKDLEEDEKLYAWRREFTGLQDKEGTDIYEGDLLDNGMGVVWSKYAFVPAYDWGRSDDFEDWGTNWNEKVKVIGNIYENRDLME